jgi:hypothetical protein
MATSTTTPNLGQGEQGPPWEPAAEDRPHEISGVHGHAGYSSVEDLDARMAAARGKPPTPQLAEPLPAPDPSGAV